MPLLSKPRRTADIVFTKWQIAVFVDGCFSYGCPVHGTSPKSNEVFWQEKMAANTTRDEDMTRRLEDLGWRIVRIWEHEPVEMAIRMVNRALSGRRGADFSDAG